MNKFPDNIVEYGRSQFCRIAYAQKRNGSMPAKEFLESLDKRERIKIARLFDWMLQSGKITNRQKFKKLQGDSNLWEFISIPYRVFAYQDGNTWFLTNGFEKRTDATPPQEIKGGVEIMREHFHK